MNGGSNPLNALSFQHCRGPRTKFWHSYAKDLKERQLESLWCHGERTEGGKNIPNPVDNKHVDYSRILER